MFQSARIKLTAWYLLIIMLISIVFSVAFYNVATLELQRIIRRAEMEQFRGNNLFLPPYLRNFPSVEELEQSKNNLKIMLIIINGVILVLAGGAGYILAGRTLQPIQNMVDEQNRFITDASHELRTPLTALRSEMEASLLENNLTDTKAKKLVESNLEEVNNLQLLSDNLLQLVQYQTNNKKNEFQKISLLQVVEDALKKVTSLAKAKKIIINNEIDDIILYGNSQSLIQLFIILFDNAIKYSPKESSIFLTSKKLDHAISIEVTDQGMGIDKKDIPHIFNRFYRADKSRTKSDIPGYGLGLAIAKKITEEHQGTIRVKTKVNKGTTFILHFPL